MSHAPHERLVRELERRITEIESASQHEYGRFGTRDWLLCTVGALLVPYAVYFWLWP